MAIVKNIGREMERNNIIAKGEHGTAPVLAHGGAQSCSAVQAADPKPAFVVLSVNFGGAAAGLEQRRRTTAYLKHLGAGNRCADKENESKNAYGNIARH